MNDQEKIPQGIVAIFIAKDGSHIANAADFSLSHPAGFSLEETQRIRAKSSLAMKAVRELSSPLLSDSVQRYDAEQILDRMCRTQGCNIFLIPIGYDD